MNADSPASLPHDDDFDWLYLNFFMISLLCWWILLNVLPKIPPLPGMYQQAIEKYRPSWDGEVLSIFHSIFATSYGIYYMFEFWDSSISEQYGTDCFIRWRGFRPVVVFAATFPSYLVVDILAEFRMANKFPGMDSSAPRKEKIVHHLLFIFATFLQWYYRRSCFQLVWLIVGESSTIFLCLRYFFMTRKNQKAIDITNIFFALTFFFARIILGGAGIYWMIRDDPNIWEELSIWHITLLLIFGGFFLNVWWLGAIVRKSPCFAKKKKSVKSE